MKFRNDHDVKVLFLQFSSFFLARPDMELQVPTWWVLYGGKVLGRSVGSLSSVCRVCVCVSGVCRVV